MGRERMRRDLEAPQFVVLICNFRSGVKCAIFLEIILFYPAVGLHILVRRSQESTYLLNPRSPL